MINLKFKIEPPLYICKKKHLEQRCKQRGYEFSEVVECILYEEGDEILVDTSNKHYPKQPKQLTNTDIGEGVGTELKSILSKFGIKSTKACSCNTKAKIMNEKGIEWCEQNINTIAEWLKEEATKRKLPFLDSIGKLLIKKAIKNTKKKQL